MTTITSAAAATHEISIKVDPNRRVVLPLQLPTMQVGETVRYHSDAGTVRIVFPGQSPFRTDTQSQTEVSGDAILPLVADDGGVAGRFICRCFVKPPNGPEIGWSVNSPDSGGEHHVKPPHTLLPGGGN